MFWWVLVELVAIRIWLLGVCRVKTVQPPANFWLSTSLGTALRQGQSRNPRKARSLFMQTWLTPGRLFLTETDGCRTVM
jgi:hypothetical protein